MTVRAKFFVDMSGLLEGIDRIDERSRVVPKAELGCAFERQCVAQTCAEIGRSAEQRRVRLLHAREVVGVIHTEPNACPRSVAGQFNERDAKAYEAFVAELAIEDGVQFFAKQLFESER